MHAESFAALCVAGLLLNSCKTAQRYSDETAPWRLTFSDMFDGRGQPDPTKWQSENYNRRDNPNGPDGWWDEDYARLDGEGNLVLSVEKVQNRNQDQDPYDFAVGMVSTKGVFEQRYGRYEIRARLPRQSGWWAAFWLFSKSAATLGEAGRDGSEIDILEGFGKSDQIRHAIHWDGLAKPAPWEEKVIVRPDIQTGFHTYVLEWTPDEYVFFVDGVETWRTSAGGVSQVPAYVKLSGEISTQDWAVTKEWAGPIDSSNYPDVFVIDYVKVWTK